MTRATAAAMKERTPGGRAADTGRLCSSLRVLHTWQDKTDRPPRGARSWSGSNGPGSSAVAVPEGPGDGAVAEPGEEERYGRPPPRGGALACMNA